MNKLRFYAADTNVFGIYADYVNEENGHRYLIQSSPHTGMSVSVYDQTDTPNIVYRNATNEQIEYTLPEGWSYEMLSMAVWYWEQGYVKGRDTR